MHRSIRSRPGSLKAKSTTAYQKSRENGDVGNQLASGGAVTGTDIHKMDDFDIKILQQKRHEAEVKRFVFFFLLEFWIILNVRR